MIDINSSDYYLLPIDTYHIFYAIIVALQENYRMKIKKETVLPDPGQSFKLFTPRLKNYFFWHYHPEYELVYVEAITGIRHVGQNISGFMESDLVLIGSNIPHLNFDYGIKTEYKQIVVQLKEQFLGSAFNETPEFACIRGLFDKAYLGLSFSGKTKEIVAKKLKYMKTLGHFEQLLCLLEIFQILASSNEVTELNEKDTSVKLFLNDKIRMGAIYKYIHAHYNQTPDVNQVAASVNLSTPAFCRYFKKQTKMTFTEFVNQYRITQAKTLLLQDKNISEVCYEVGIESLSYFNKLFKKITGENPSAFKKRYA
ncbi:MAG: AraC family transcriptional regulator [Ginsengibacter sp.]